VEQKKNIEKGREESQKSWKRLWGRITDDRD